MKYQGHNRRSKVKSALICYVSAVTQFYMDRFSKKLAHMFFLQRLCVAHESQVHIWKDNGKIGGQRSKDGLFCHVSAVIQSNIDWSFNNLVQMFSYRCMCAAHKIQIHILKVKVTTRGQKSCNDKKIGFLTFDLWFWPWTLSFRYRFCARQNALSWRSFVQSYKLVISC